MSFLLCMMPTAQTHTTNVCIYFRINKEVRNAWTPMKVSHFVPSQWCATFCPFWSSLEFHFWICISANYGFLLMPSSNCISKITSKKSIKSSWKWKHVKSFPKAAFPPSKFISFFGTQKEVCRYSLPLCKCHLLLSK